MIFFSERNGYVAESDSLLSNFWIKGFKRKKLIKRS
jgi:hypothetical protein